MVTANQISRYRKAAGLSQEALGALLGLTKFQVSRLENGETALSVETAFRMAQVLGTTIEQLVGKDGQANLSGFAEELSPYVSTASDRLSQALTSDHVYLFTVETDAVDLGGYPRGMVVQINDSKRAVQMVKPLQAVRVLYHPAGSENRAISLLRLFLPPRLLITNSSVKNLPSLDMDNDDAHIVGVVEGGYRRFG
jgi:transcriptional regulator with XRE-family HTH domain